MISAVTKRIEELTRADLVELTQRRWPESENVEYKGELAREGKKPESWSADRKLSDSAKRPLLKTLIAFANTSGGRLFLGIEETSDRPPRAGAISPIPACADLAERFEQAVINLADPPLTFFRVLGVPTENDGSGVVIANVSASYSGPHRSRLDLQTYVRKGANSVPVTMREIHDIVMRLSRRADETQRRLAERERDFHTWFGHRDQYANPVVGFRISAIPVGAPLYVERVFENTDVSRDLRPVIGTIVQSSNRSQPREFYPTNTAFGERKILGGTLRLSAPSEDRYTLHETMRDGRIDVWYRFNPRPVTDRRLLFDWIVANSANVLLGIDAFRNITQSPQYEYAMVLEFVSSNGPAFISLAIVTNFPPSRIGDEIGTPLSLGPYEVGDKNVVMNTVLRDLTDATGDRFEAPRIEIQWPTA